MAHIADRIDRFKTELITARTGCPAATEAMKHADDTAMFVGISGDTDQQIGRIKEAYEKFWGEDRAQILALFPETEPESLAHSSDIFRELFFNLAKASHWVLTETISENVGKELTPDEEQYWEFLARTLYNHEDFHLFEDIHGDTVWSYLSENNPFKYDLLAVHSDDNANSLPVTNVPFVMGPYYPEYPDHLRYASDAALILSKGSDVEDLATNPKRANLYAATNQWSRKCTERYVKGVHVSFPTMPIDQSFALRNRYVELRDRLTEEEGAPELHVSNIEKFHGLTFQCEIPKQIVPLLAAKLPLDWLNNALQQCVDNGIKGPHVIIAIRKLMQAHPPKDDDSPFSTDL